MKDKLITRWNELNRDRFEIDDAYLWPLMAEMDRIRRVLQLRYNYSPIYSTHEL